MTDTPRRFHLQRDTDITGASGTGRVAWRGDRPSTVHWGSLADVEHVHRHGGHTRIAWDDPDPEPRYEPVPGCPHCPDGHTPPDHGQPWGAYVGPERDGDGQPTTIHVARTGGAHVAESDAQWIRDRLNGDTTR